MRRSSWVAVLFAATMFLSSFLLLLVQPMQGKLLLPLLGGAPAVWNTCMVFFQAVLLLGYLYAHGLVTRCSPRVQLGVHVLMLTLSLLLLRPGLAPSMAQSPLLTAAPILWVIAALALSSGPVFFAVSTTSPLLQAWFSRTGLEGSGNPYVLYAAGNVGSLAALVSYPFIVEPHWRLEEQLHHWMVGYRWLLVLIVAAGAVMLWLGADRIPASAQERVSLLPVRTRLRETLRWVVLAIVPSSLMLGATTFITTDLASVPMLWLLPLTLYMLSFVIVFGRYSERIQRMVLRPLPVLVVATLLLTFADYHGHLGALVALHLVTFLAIAVACHGRLALERPEPARLTEFYFCLSLGGVLGGAFNSFVAPFIFSNIAEYPLVLVLSLAVVGQRRPRPGARALLAYLAGFVCLLFVTYGMTRLHAFGLIDRIAERLESIDRGLVRSVLIFGLPILLAVPLRRQRRLFTAALLGVVAVALSVSLKSGVILLRDRSFFGVITVAQVEDPKKHVLVHGGIVHGEQRLDSEQERQRPRAYYHQQGPLGQIMAALHQRVERPRVGAVGLGAGALAAYGTAGTELTFFELDPNVERVASDTRYFTYLDDCRRRGCQLSVEIGDGRLALQRTQQRFDLIVIDAFNSDSIPIHLITAEALRIYLDRLRPGGVIAFHISNNYVNLRPVLYNLTRALHLHYAVRDDEEDEPSIGLRGSTWAVAARTDDELRVFAADSRWKTSETPNGVGVWADDYAQIVSAITWF